MFFEIGIASSLDFGGKNGTLIGSYIKTDWMKVDANKHSWLCSADKLVGDVEIKGTMILQGKVDVVFTIFDDNKEVQFNLNKVDISASGGQLAGTKIRGSIVNMMGKEHLGGGLCAPD